MTLEEYRAAIERLPSMVELGKLSSILAGQVSKLMAESAGRGPVLKNMESRIADLADLDVAVAAMIGRLGAPRVGRERHAVVRVGRGVAVQEL